MDIFYQKLKISKQEFQFQFQSHPNYPSALAFSDTLNFLNISNQVFKIEKEFWHELPYQFIAIYNGNYAFVESSNDDYFLFTDKKEKISKEVLFNNTEDIVFTFEKNEDLVEKHTISTKYYSSILIFASLLVSFFNSDLSLVYFNVLSAIGLLISVELFNNKFGTKSTVLENFCNISANSKITNSCDKIFSSDKINVFGLKLSDFSLIYFLSFLILGITVPKSIFVLKYASYLSATIISYSLYIQIIKQKIFCKVCFIIILTLIAQIIISSQFFNNNFELRVFLISILVFTSVFFMTFIINNAFKLKEKYYIMNLKNNRFKRNYEIFKKQVFENSLDLIVNNDEFLLGNKDSKLKISLVTHLYCGHCKEAYEIIEKIIKKYPEISVQIRFNIFSNNTDENLELLISTLKNIYQSKGDLILLEAVEFWHITKDIERFKIKYPLFAKDTDISGIIELAEENNNIGLTNTPQILINNYLFSNLYEREDIFYFLDELLEDEDLK